MAVTEKELSTTGRIRNLFDQARSHRRPRIDSWQRMYRLVHNKVWSPIREAWMPSPSASEIYPIVAAMVGWMTDQRPSLQVVPSADPHSAYSEFMSQLARDLEKTLQANWIQHQLDGEVEKVLWDSMIYGTGFVKVIWDASLIGGLGDAKMKRVDPYSFYPDPQATNMEDGNYFIEARNVSLQELDRRFPGASKLVEDEAVRDSNLDKRQDPYVGSGDVAMANPGGISGAAPRYGAPGQGRREHVYYDEGITLIEAWVREHTLWSDNDGEDYVEDRWRVVVVAGNHVLMDEPASELFGHGRHPFVRYLLHDLGDFWGISLVEHLAPLQISMNRLLSALQANAELIGNPVFVEDTRSGIPRTKIINKPGQRLTKNQGSEVTWLPPPDMPPGVSDLVRFYIQEMERISGLSAMVRGATPTGRNAQGVLDAVQEAAFVRVRLALRSLERTLREAGNLLASLVVENYSTPRMVAITGPQGERSSLALRGRHFYIPTDEGALPMRFSLWVEAGSAMPISRHARAAEADVLYAMGAIDVQAVLEAHDWPNRQEVLQRVNALKQAGLMEPPGSRQKSGRKS